MRHIAVIDIGKTNAKVALVELSSLTEIAVAKRPNAVLKGPPYPHYDVEGLWAFILDGLKRFQAEFSVDAISITTHGASAVLLDAEGKLAAPALDYEFDGPDTLAAEYDAARPPFAETGSARLPLGLNLGAQLFWQFRTFPGLKEKTRTILTYPQYWAFRLSGVAVNEVTSLGCHTDLWMPEEGRYSSLVDREGWRELMAPVARAADRLGPVLPEIAAATGLPADIPVICGIHDSNASLYAHLSAREAPFAVVSTGTWVISMAVGGAKVALDPARDTLVNVNAYGDPVPSARFMGGREFERLIGDQPKDFAPADIDSVLARASMLLPAIENQSGPFQGRNAVWTVDQSRLTPAERYVTVSFYLALMTSTGLEIVGAQGPVLVEGPFAENRAYLAMLAAVAGRPVEAVAGTGTSIGAALLVGGARLAGAKGEAERPANEIALRRYAEAWRASL
ncbi:FGGY-family carbohydrate kinase [Rhizobium sp. C4]|uniref:FGGY-family carbohydrate kinase n=1 Tax=Rhizobium sp. C4 TaxID=1349800 RepID=UPI001E5501DB|nr:FGGY-family carbohydrate kinase [Rhizobium sp. C4]MCD2174232.1 FGGY-family carbohydrate kinase [Rhizobium sp. C4]